jgi:hypothetical protein
MANPAPFALVLGPICASLITGSSASQCAIDWLPHAGLPGVNSHAFVVAPWDPDGSGPAPEVAVVGGAFTIAGDVSVGRIATYSPVTNKWSSLGGPGGGFSDGAVYAACALSDGSLLVGGTFASGLARWHGGQWQQLGGIMNGPVFDVAKLPNGNVVAIGDFTSAGGVLASRIAVYDFVSNSWIALGAGTPHTSMKVGVRPNGDIILSVRVFNTGQNQLHCWSGSSWTQIASPNGSVWSIFNLPNGDLGIAGGFTSIGGVSTPYLAKWDGTSWSPLGSGPGHPSTNGCATIMPDGSVVFAGLGFTRRWNGVAWSSLGSGLDSAISLAALATGDLIAAGYTSVAGGLGVFRVARWNGTAWSAMGGGGPTQPVRALAMLSNGRLIAGCEYPSAYGSVANCVMQWDGVAWQPLGTGVNGGVVSLLALPNGDLIAGGYFSMAGGAPASKVARWNGSSWQPMGWVLTSAVHALARLPNGDIVAAGEFVVGGSVVINRIARWNGTAWLPLGSGCNDTVLTLAVLPNGDLVAGGIFTTAGGLAVSKVARWNGSSWSPLGSGLPEFPLALHVRPNGELIAGGGSGLGWPLIHRWDGSAWSGFASGLSGAVWAFTTLHNGDLVAAGNFTTTTVPVAKNVARWNGSAWLRFGPGPDEMVYAVQPMPDNHLAIGGLFHHAGGAPSPNFVRLTTQCPATVTTYGTGCGGSAGTIALDVDTPPWIGGEFRATATGFAPNTLAVGVGGLQPMSTPLTTALPMAAPGCELLATTDAVYWWTPTAGQVQAVLPVPLSVVYIGKDIYFQMLSLELAVGQDPVHPVVHATSSAALALVVGSF